MCSHFLVHFKGKVGHDFLIQAIFVFNVGWFLQIEKMLKKWDAENNNSPLSNNWTEQIEFFNIEYLFSL